MVGDDSPTLFLLPRVGAHTYVGVYVRKKKVTTHPNSQRGRIGGTCVRAPRIVVASTSLQATVTHNAGSY